MFTKAFVLAATAFPCFTAQATVHRQAPSDRARTGFEKQQCIISTESSCEEDKNFLVEIPNFLDQHEIKLYHQSFSGNGKIPVARDIVDRLVATLDDVEGRPKKRSLQALHAFQEKGSILDDDNLLLVGRKTIRKTTPVHADKYREGHTQGSHTTGNSAFVFLNSREGAYFAYGGDKVPVEAGKLVVFDGRLPHHTVLPTDEGASSTPVTLLGAFDTDHLYMVGSTLVVEVFIDGINVKDFDNQTLTVGEPYDIIVEFDTDVDFPENVTISLADDSENEIDVTCPVPFDRIDNCTGTFTPGTLGAAMETVRGTYDIGVESPSEVQSFDYFGVAAEEDDEEEEEEESCSGIFCCGH